jgi:hypothetical protein
LKHNLDVNLVNIIIYYSINNVVNINFFVTVFFDVIVQFFAYKMSVASENLMFKHMNVDLNTVSLKASDCALPNLANKQHALKENACTCGFKCI